MTNAGRGSNLTLAGTVECDAAIMSGEGLRGGVGAMPGVDHPIAAAHLLACKSQEQLPCGLVPPVCVVFASECRHARTQRPAPMAA